MKKVLTITLLCLFTNVVLFGAFNVIYSSGANTAELRKAWEDAEKAIKTANDRMDEIEKARIKYQSESWIIVSLSL